MKEFNGQIFFIANEALTGYELYKTDGTAAGTVLVKDIHPTESSEPMPVSALATTERAYVSGTPKLFWFGASDARGRELWSSDGTTAGTVIWKDFCATGSSLSY